MGGYEIAPEPEDLPSGDVSETEVDLTEAESDVDAGDEVGGDETADEGDDEGPLAERARHLAADEPSGELPAIEELSQRIDSAFDDIVAEADEVSEGAQRPWEDG